MTIHLIPADDAGWMLPLFEPGIESWSRRRLGQLGMSDRDVEAALRTIAKALADEGPLSRSELAERVTAAGVELNAQTRLHIMGLAVVSGLGCLGAQDRVVRREDWLGKLPPFDRDAALAELARRYLRAFGPASDRDFAYWAGLGLREVRAGLAAISGEVDEADGLLSLRGAKPRLPRAGWVRMLGAFDTYLLGYRDRGFCVTPEQAKAVKEGGGGWIRPVIVRDGKVVGGWRASRKGGKLEVSVSVEDPALREAVDAELADIARFEDADVVSA